MSDGEVHGPSVAIGELRAEVRGLTEASLQVSHVLGQLSNSVIRLEHTVSDIKPEVEASRKEREQRAGAAQWRGRMLKAGIMIGSGVGSAATAVSALRWLWAKG